MLRSSDTTPTERGCNDQEGTIGYRAVDRYGSCSQATRTEHVLMRAAVTPHRAAIMKSRCGGSKQIKQHVAEYVCHPTTKLNLSSSRV